MPHLKLATATSQVHRRMQLQLGGSPVISDNVINYKGKMEFTSIGVCPSRAMYFEAKDKIMAYTEGLATIIGNNITNCYTGIYAVGLQIFA